MWPNLFLVVRIMLSVSHSLKFRRYKFPHLRGGFYLHFRERDVDRHRGASKTFKHIKLAKKSERVLVDEKSSHDQVSPHAFIPVLNRFRYIISFIISIIWSPFPPNTSSTVLSRIRDSHIVTRERCEVTMIPFSRITIIAPFSGRI